MCNLSAQQRGACQFVNLEKTDSDITAQTEGWTSSQRAVTPQFIKI